MTKKIIQEISLGVILSLLVVSFLDPFMLWMPSSLLMTLLFLLVVVFIIFSVFIWREKAQDEREAYHRLLSSRAGFLAGSLMLVLAVIWQGFKHQIDPWILYSLLVMILTKIIARVYGNLKN